MRLCKCPSRLTMVQLHPLLQRRCPVAMAPLAQPLTLKFTAQHDSTLIAATRLMSNISTPDDADLLFTALGTAKESTALTYRDASGVVVGINMDDLWRQITAAFASDNGASAFRQRFGACLSVHHERQKQLLTLTVTASFTSAPACHAPAAAAAAQAVWPFTGSQEGESKVRSL